MVLRDKADRDISDYTHSTSEVIKHYFRYYIRLH